MWDCHKTPPLQLCQQPVKSRKAFQVTKQTEGRLVHEGVLSDSPDSERFDRGPNVAKKLHLRPPGPLPKLAAVLPQTFDIKTDSVL
jgi:hypothetical protein